MTVIPGWLRDRRFLLGFGSGFGLAALVAVLLVAVLRPWMDGSRSGLEPGEIVIMGGRDDSVGQAKQKLIEQWNTQHPDHPARIIELSRLSDAARNEMVKQAQSGGLAVDIYNLDVIWTAEFAENGYIRELDGVDTEGFLAGPLETGRYQGDLYALPFNTDAGLLYHRAEVPAPESWESLVEQVRRTLGQPHAPELVAGYLGQLANYEGLLVNVLEASPDGGLTRSDDDGEYHVDRRKVQIGVDHLRPNVPGPPGEPVQIVLPESLSMDEQASDRAFREGEALYMRNWPLGERGLLISGGPGPAEPWFGIAQLPGRNTVLGGQNLAIANGSARPNAARELITFLTSQQSQEVLFRDGGYAATRAAVYRDPEVLERYPYAQTLLKAIQDSRPRPASPCYARFSAVFRNAVSEALSTGNPLPADFEKQLALAGGCAPQPVG